MNDSSDARCPRCQAPLGSGAPEGLCPRCLIALNLAAETEEFGPGGTKVLSPTIEPLPIAELQKHFPQFEMIEFLGRGGMGLVYKARQSRLDRFIALKILAPDPQNRGRFAERFEREARALAKLSHPNIVSIYDFGESGGLYFLVMEFVDGMNLRELLRANKITPEEALAIVPRICDALQFAHSQGIVHRDIKPENILLDKSGRVKIADFGIAKILGNEPAENLTGERQAVGTPHYMAPEQVEKPATVDHRADIYSLGVVFYEMLTGELPLGKFAPPSRKTPVDVRLDDVVLRALEKEPGQRYQQAVQVKTDVETIAATQPHGVKAQPFHGKRWRDRWLWDSAFLPLYLGVPALLATTLTLFLLPRLGVKALWFFALELAGLGFAVTYGLIGQRVRRLKATVATGEVAEALMFRRPFQSPGIAVLYEDRLELIPVAGSPITVNFTNIVAVREVRWFNGTRLWWKQGFVLELADGGNAGLAVAEPFARKWRARLSGGALPETPFDSNAPSNFHFKFNPFPTLLPGERVLHFKKWLWAMSGKSLPSYRLSFSLPLFCESGLYVTDRRLIVVSSIVRLLHMEFNIWFSKKIKARNVDVLHGVSAGRNVFGTYLEINSEANNTASYRSAKLRARIYTREAELLRQIIFDAHKAAETSDGLANPLGEPVPDSPPAASLPRRFFSSSAWYFGVLAASLLFAGLVLWGTLGGKSGVDRNRPGNAAFEAKAPPVVIKTIPESGSSGVDPSLQQIRVTFSEQMRDGNWSWVQLDGESFPGITGEPKFLSDQRTCLLPVKIEPGKVYAIWINSEEFKNFKDRSGEPAVPYLLVFETRK